jgi:hypothetical protein
VTNWPPLDSQSGVNFTGSEIKIQQIEDGASNTYMIGEKNLDPDTYEGVDTTASEEGYYGSGGDGQGYFVGFDWDTHRWAMEPPYRILLEPTYISYLAAPIRRYGRQLCAMDQFAPFRTISTSRRIRGWLTAMTERQRAPFSR